MESWDANLRNDKWDQSIQAISSVDEQVADRDTQTDHRDGRGDSARFFARRRRPVEGSAPKRTCQQIGRQPNKIASILQEHKLEVALRQEGAGAVCACRSRDH